MGKYYFTVFVSSKELNKSAVLASSSNLRSANTFPFIVYVKNA